MLIASLIFVFSLSAMTQFVLLQWRAGLIVVAEKFPISQADPAAQLARNLLNVNDFSNLEAFRNLCPNLGKDSAPRLGSVRFYRSFLQLLGKWGPAEWAQSEMELCAKYASAVLMQQVERNQMVAAQISSF